MQIYNYIREISSVMKKAWGDSINFLEFSTKRWNYIALPHQHLGMPSIMPTKGEVMTLTCVVLSNKCKAQNFSSKDLKLINNGYLGGGSHCSNHMVSRGKEPYKAMFLSPKYQKSHSLVAKSPDSDSIWRTLTVFQLCQKICPRSNTFNLILII